MAQVIANHDHAVERIDPEPDPWRSGPLRDALVSALESATSSTSNPNPDDPEPTGPGAPRIREMTAALALMQMGSLISDRAARRTIQKAAAGVLATHAEHIASH
jgi:hypothetical protein